MRPGLVLADKSAIEQQHRVPAARTLLTKLAKAGRLATCDVVALEVLYSARNRTHYERLERALRRHVWLPIHAPVTERSMEVQRLLMRRGQHRLSIADLIIAATAELHGAAVLHFDRDFDRISAVSGQETRWIVTPPR